MASRKDSPDKKQVPIWERSEPSNRPAPAPLSREAIVAVAISIADEEGVANVSLRKVAAALGAGPMRLYRYVSTKQDLLDLMVDSVYGEMTTMQNHEDLSGAISFVAHSLRRASQLHPWFADLLGSRPHQGPNALAYLESLLAAFDHAQDFDIDRVVQASTTVYSYVIGAIRIEAREKQAERESGLSKSEWQGQTGPYLQRMISTGRIPTIAKVVRGAAHPSPDVVFDRGLHLVISGITGGKGEPNT